MPRPDAHRLRERAALEVRHDGPVPKGALVDEGRDAALFACRAAIGAPVRRLRGLIARHGADLPAAVRAALDGELDALDRVRAALWRLAVEDQSTVAVASISTSSSGTARPLTTTRVLAGNGSRRYLPRAARTASTKRGSVM